MLAQTITESHTHALRTIVEIDPMAVLDGW